MEKKEQIKKDRLIKERTKLFMFFIERDGVISYSLRDITLILTTVISISFLAMLYVSCSHKLLKC